MYGHGHWYIKRRRTSMGTTVDLSNSGGLSDSDDGLHYSQYLPTSILLSTSNSLLRHIREFNCPLVVIFRPPGSDSLSLWQQYFLLRWQRLWN